MSIRKALLIILSAFICLVISNNVSAESMTYTVFGNQESVFADGSRLYFTIPFDYTPSTLTISIRAVGGDYSWSSSAIELYDIKTDTHICSFSGRTDSYTTHTVDISGKGNTFYFAHTPYPKNMKIIFEYCIAQCDVLKSSDIFPVFKVLSGVPFKEALYSAFSGNSNGVTATTIDGYTELTGTLTINNGSNQQIFKVVIDGKPILFKVIAPPVLNTVATVTFT